MMAMDDDFAADAKDPQCRDKRLSLPTTNTLSLYLSDSKDLGLLSLETREDMLEPLEPPVRANAYSEVSC